MRCSVYAPLYALLMPLSRRTLYIISGALVIATLAVVYFMVDPALSRFVPKCVFYELTGWQCAGCGSQRLIHALLHGHVAEAFRYNPLLFCGLPLVPFFVWLELCRTRHPRLYARVYSPTFCAGAALIVIAYTVLRNLL